jgi:biopolymer transport protein ExbD
MAEIQVSGKSGRAVMAPRIDLTPMVDLGFLLITFFMMTTTMSKPKAMDISMPYKPASTDEVTAFYESSAITLIPAKDHRVFYYEGLYHADQALKEVSSKNEPALRKILVAKQATLSRRPLVKERDLQVLIKPDTDATMEDIVSLLDEMSILKVSCYALVDINPEEAQKVNMLITGR